MRIPLRYTYATCSVMLATIKSGPSGARSGSQTYWPGFRLTVSGDTRMPSVKVSANMNDQTRTNDPVRITIDDENKDFMALTGSWRVTRDASGRSRLSILLALTQVGLAVLGSRL